MNPPTHEIESLTPMFSVIMPIHNKAPHIERAVLSVLQQSFQCFEIIMVDDASSDDSFEIMSRFDDPRIKVLRRTEPGPGGYAGRNYAMAHASGKWAAFLDADDEWLPEHLAKLNELASLYPEAYLLGAGWRTSNGATSKNCAFYEQFNSAGCHSLSLFDYVNRCLKGHRRAVHTSIAAVRLDSSETPELFPAASGAKRGGDLYAWIKMAAKYQPIAWSNHIGAIYYVDSVNMVTKTSPSSPVLWSAKSLNKLTSALTNSERRILGQYFNRALKHGWLNNTMNNHSQAGFSVGVNKEAGLRSYCYHKLLMAMPAWLIKLVKRVKG